MEREVILKFACCHCKHSIGVTLKCSGKGLSACHACHQPIGVTVQCAGKHLDGTARIVASVVVPCPCCGHMNKLLFEPNGTVHDVRPVQQPARIPEPSIN